jgi:hypothetical protein
MNYEEDIEIDPSALDVESLRQASLFYQYSKAEAEAKNKHQLAWEKIKVIRSELILQAAEDKALKNAQAVEAYYRNHPKHIKAKEELMQAEYDQNIASAACFAMRQRKDMIENLTRLAMADYFARPSEPRDLAGESGKKREEQTERVRERAGSKLEGRRRRGQKQ